MSMDRGSKVLFAVTCVAIALSIFALFYKALILQDFERFVSDESNNEGSTESTE